MLRLRLSLLVIMTVSISMTQSAEPWPKPGSLPKSATYPDPRVRFDGTTIATVKDWETQRRPELKTLFEHYMYGRLPASSKLMKCSLLYENTKAFDGKVWLREIELEYQVNEITNPTPIRLLIAVPSHHDKPVPCFVGLMFCGNHAIVPDEGIRIPDSWQYDRQPGVVKNKASAEGRGKQMETWPIELITSKGFGLAAFYAGDVQPDRPNVAEAMRTILPKDSDTATVMSWAFGIHRVVDFLQNEKSVDGKKLIAVGHSRLGKATLLAGAFDDRIAVVIPHQAGCGGTGPSRHNDPKAEAVSRINTSFPHWFCSNFKEFNDDTERLPFDQNGLVALCAPRAVLYSNAVEDLWANPSGQLAILKAAEPVYKLYGVDGCATRDMPEVNQLIDSRLGYFIRPGKHSMTTTDWQAFLKYAAKWTK
jgi:hypothetical protein